MGGLPASGWQWFVDGEGPQYTGWKRSARGGRQLPRKNYRNEFEGLRRRVSSWREMADTVDSGGQKKQNAEGTADACTWQQNGILGGEK